MILVEKTGLVPGTLIQRYKRFLADVRLADGSVVTAHTTNTGSMKTCWEPGDQVLLEPAGNPDRKLKFTWLAVERLYLNTQSASLIAQAELVASDVAKLLIGQAGIVAISMKKG